MKSGKSLVLCKPLPNLLQSGWPVGPTQSENAFCWTFNPTFFVYDSVNWRILQKGIFFGNNPFRKAPMTRNLPCKIIFSKSFFLKKFIPLATSNKAGSKHDFPWNILADINNVKLLHINTCLIFWYR